MKKRLLRKTLLFVPILFGMFVGAYNEGANIQPAAAQSLDYTFRSTKSSVNTGESFDIEVKLTNNSGQQMYSISAYLYQAHMLENTTTTNISPSYNATYNDPAYSSTYNPQYWTNSSLADGQNTTFKVTFQVNSDAPEGRLKTIDYSPITQGTDPSSATETKVSELLVDVKYYVDLSGQDSSKRTIRGYIDLPSVTHPMAAVSSKVLPETFRSPGTSSTDLSLITEIQAQAFTGFTLDTATGNKIVWKAPIDMTSATFLARIETLDTYAFITAPGYVSVDTTMAPFLDVEAEIVFKNVRFISTPKLLKDGEDASDAIQNTGVCSTTSRTCAFTVPGFSDYKLTPTVTLELEESTDQQQYVLEGLVDELDAELKYRLNDGEWIAINEVDIGTGGFRAEVLLSEGENTIEVKATSKNGEEDIVSDMIVLGDIVVGTGEDDTGQGEEKAANVLLNILGIILVVVSLTIGIVMWYVIYKKKQEDAKKPKIHSPKKMTTKVISKEKIIDEKKLLAEKKAASSEKPPK